MPAQNKTLQITAKGISGSKSWTIKNPVDSKNFSSEDAATFVGLYGTTYGSELTLSTATYIETEKTQVYPNN